jgi:hypothetical protein
MYRKAGLLKSAGLYVLAISGGVMLGMLIGAWLFGTSSDRIYSRIFVVPEKGFVPPKTGIDLAVFVYGSEFYDVRGNEIAYQELWRQIPPKATSAIWFNISVDRNDPAGLETAYQFAAVTLRRTEKGVLVDDAIWILIKEETKGTQLINDRNG